jgi:biotin carboxylase
MTTTRQRRVLLCATTTGYQIRSFDEAAAALGVELVLATDRCDHLDDPWRDRAIPVRFHDESASCDAVIAAVGEAGIDGVIAVGDRPVVLAALVAERLGLPWHEVEAARASRDKRQFRDRLRAAGLAAPWSRVVPLDAPPPTDVSFPCVVKPLVLSGSRGVIRADDPPSLAAALDRVGRILSSPDVRALRDPAAGLIQVEGFVPGFEVALEGVLERGRLHVLALFDKPDPLDGPFFEETLYVTPTPRGDAVTMRVIAAVTQAVRAAGLWHGPVHAECRVRDDAVVVLEAAARPIGGLCAGALRFEGAAGEELSLEGLLLRAAIGERLFGWRRRPGAAGVLMVPIAKSGMLREVRGVEAAGQVPNVTGVVVSAKPGQRLDALPEAAGYLGFVFAEAPEADAVEAALRAAGACLSVEVDAAIDVNAR